MSNRLEKEDSPYLQQHKDNPVDWWPWCDEAFDKAKKENKAIFISIGYSSCHWCHVMEERVFEDEECAQILNENFISIKVDREERPDIDKHYQEVYMLLNRRAGGWPTSIFSTPENKPFFAGTYIPPESQQGSIEGMGFKELTRLIGRKVSQNDEQILKNAEEIEGFLQNRSHPKEATKLNETFVKNFMLQAQSNYEHKFGGFSQAPKFPQVATLDCLMTIDRLYDDKVAKAMFIDTLNNMKKGGFYDLVDGGFCRYSTDNKWLVPHFEKMLYDNALLCELYTKSFMIYNDKSHLNIAKEIAEFLLTKMSKNNLFYSASDADTDGSEGDYFVYSYEELYIAFKANNLENIEELLKSLGVTPEGNFEGKNIINFENNVEPENFKSIKKILIELRESKEYPFKDKKVQVSWSSMMIKSLFTLGYVESEYTKIAVDSLDILMKTMYKENILYHSVLVGKTPKVEAFLEDYAFLGTALIEGFNATQDETYLIQAQTIANKALELFYNQGSWNFSVGEFETKAEITDSTYISSTNIMIDLLQSLSTLVNDEKYKHFAFKTLEYNSYELGRKPIYYPYMLKQMLRYIKGDRVVKSRVNNLIENLSELKKVKYPFIQLKLDDIEDFMICGDKNCFSQVKLVQEIESAINKSL